MRQQIDLSAVRSGHMRQFGSEFPGLPPSVIGQVYTRCVNRVTHAGSIVNGNSADAIYREAHRQLSELKMRQASNNGPKKPQRDFGSSDLAEEITHSSWSKVRPA